METKYKLNARDLTHSFVASVQSAYLDRDIEIIVREAEDSWDETEYLSRSPANTESATPITDALSGILSHVGDVTLEEIRAERLAKYEK